MNTLTLKELIKAVENCGLLTPEQKPKNMYFDFGTAIPTHFNSWRGSYDLLALSYKLTGHGDYNGLQKMKADEFIQMCKNTIGARFTGYKGSEYQMSDHTPVWIDNYGDYTETGLIGVESSDYSITLKTARLEY